MSGAPNRFTGKWIGQRYCIEQELGRGGMGAVFRAFHVDDPSNDVAIKLINRTKKMSSTDLMRFQKEAALMSQLYHSNIIAFHELGIFQGEESKDFTDGYYIVMDYARGKNLKDSLRDDGRKDLAFLFQVGLQVADALDYTHGKNIIHRDIKPHNIIISEAPGDKRGVHVRVLDFGVARLGNVMGRDDNAGEERAGTPLYMAPEQSATGFGVPDHRVDLYSLGCVLYEILAGHAPFSGDNRMALERAHQSAEPEPIQNIRPDVPNVVAQIIHKLLAKRPDDRYQTAFSLSADLLRAKSLWERKPTSVPSFPLALKDKFFAVSAQLPIQGRGRELNAIISEYKQVAEVKARGRITVVSGASGMGKTRVLNEFQNTLASQRIKFVSGVFTQHENALPFNALANAFNELLVRMAKTSPVDADVLSRRLKQIIGPDSHLVASVVPGLKPYLVDIPEPDDGIDIDGEKYARFAKAFSDFTRSLVPESQPLVLILDDVHWADEKSLSLIEQFFSNANSLRFHLVIGCRLDIAQEGAPFSKFLAKFRGLKLRYAEITLSPLDFEACQLVVSSMLRHSKAINHDLIEHLMARSGGVPLRLVELTRRMVGLDMIRIEKSDKGWEWDIQEIQGGKVSLTAVDLVLGRIVEYKGVDLSILRSAASCGLSFQYETLLLNGRNSPSNVVRLIERAQDDGLIVRNSELPDLKHLGKSYIFVHKKVRDAIYNEIDEAEKRTLHGLIAEQLLATIERPKEQMLFALAQHLNKSRTADGNNSDRDRLALKYNIDAGDAIKLKQGWTAANNYYRIALEIVDHSKDSLADPTLRRRLIERLADVNAGQTNFKTALARYAELLQQPMSPQEFAAAAAKAAQLHIVCGNISEAANIINKGLAAIGFAPPKLKFGLQLFYLWVNFVDAVLGVGKSNKIVLGLEQAWRSWRKYGEKGEQMFALTKLLYLSSIVGARQSVWLARASHLAARRQLTAGKSAASIAIKVAADRAVMLAQTGSVTSAYRLFDTAERFASEARYSRSSGYVSLMRATSIDYMKGRFDDVALHVKEASQKIDNDQDRLSFANLMAFRQYLDLCSGKLEFQMELNAELRRAVPTRNWWSSVSMAILMFSMLLQGRRQRLVKVGEDFTRRRKAVGARDDLFNSVVNIILYFARGEDDQTRAHFAKLVKRWAGRVEGEYLQPWQSDFLLIFMIVFPTLFEVEFGRQLARNEEMYNWLKLLRDGSQPDVPFLIRERPAQLLVGARVKELTASQDAKSAYDRTLRDAKTEGNMLLQIISYAWFGGFLVKLGHARRGDYLNNALKFAREAELFGLADIVEKMMSKLNVLTDSGVASDPELPSSVSLAVNPWPTLIVQHMDHLISSINSDSELEVDIQQSIALLKTIYPDAPMTVFLSGSQTKEKVLFTESDTGHTESLVRAAAPYLTIRSTLLLHMAPARADLVAGADDRGLGGEDLVETMRQLDGLDMGATHVFAEPMGQQMDSSQRTQTSDSADKVPGGSVSSSGWEGMQALIPIRAGGETLGLVVLGGIGAQGFSAIQRSKRELDTFGAQLGVLASYKFAPVLEHLRRLQKPNPTDFSVMGGTFFDEVSWLKVNVQGKLRKEREASWYLGLNWTSNQYLVLYCCVKGDVMDRDRFAMLIMLHALVMRELVAMMGHAKSDITDLRNQIQMFMSSHGLASRMDDILLSFSLFERDGDVVSSGHYGPSRPVVLGTENRVTAFNQASLRLRDGRDLRYWEIFAPMGKEHVFIVSYDTSRIDVENKDLAGVLSRSNHGDDPSRINTRLLETAVEQKMLPRYYLVITRA